MALRFQEKGQYLRSFVGENSLFIDIMMNVGIIFYAARETGDRKLRDIALRHCLTTRRVLVRGDGSTAHEGIFDLETGEFLRQTHAAGLSRRFLLVARPRPGRSTASACPTNTAAIRAFWRPPKPAPITTSRTPTADGVPPWDFNAPPESRKLLDTSAAAIAASGSAAPCRLLQDPVKGHHLLVHRDPHPADACAKSTWRSKDKKWEGILEGRRLSRATRNWAWMSR